MNESDSLIVSFIKDKKRLYGDEFTIEYVCQVLKAAGVIDVKSTWMIPQDGTSVKYARLYPKDQQVITVD